MGFILLTAAKALAALSILWAAAALIVQLVGAWDGGRKDYSRRAGDPVRGIFYNFTVGMAPAHKESARRHPGKFAVGLLLHVGVISVICTVLLLLIWPQAVAWTNWFVRPFVLLGLLAGIYLLVRRVLSKDLRSLSAPDDYIAILATCGLLAMGSLYYADARAEPVFLVYVALLAAYLPIGKLRHAAFFFAARVDLGRRLGYRGVYPPPPRETGYPDVR